jgi:hypothetical protein
VLARQLLSKARMPNLARLSVLSAQTFACLVCLALARPAAAAISFQNLRPADGARFPTPISGAVLTTSRLLSAVAEVDGVMHPLRVWSNHFGPLSNDEKWPGLTFGSKTVKVTVTNLDKETATQSIHVFANHPPRVVIEKPSVHTTTAAFVDVEARCEDDDPGGCTRLELFQGEDDPMPLATGTTRVSGRVTLSAGGGMRLVATDSVGSETTTFDVIFETSPHLRLVDWLPEGAQARGVDASRTLLEDEASTTLVDRSTGSRTALPSGPDGRCETGWLTPAGVLAHCDHIVLWNPGKTVDLGLGDFPRAKASAAFWWTPDNLSVRVQRLDTGAGRPIKDVAPGLSYELTDNNDVTESGSLVFFRSDGNGNATLLRDDGRKSEVLRRGLRDVQSTTGYLTADGPLVAYQVEDDKGPALWLHDEGGKLVNLGKTFPFERSEEQRRPMVLSTIITRGGWTAFVRATGGDGSEVWLRAPGGKQTRVKACELKCWLLALSPGGDLLFHDYKEGRRMRSLRGAAPEAAGWIVENNGEYWIPRAFWSSGFYVVVGDGLFYVTGTGDDAAQIAGTAPPAPPITPYPGTWPSAGPAADAGAAPLADAAGPAGADAGADAGGTSAPHPTATDAAPAQYGDDQPASTGPHAPPAPPPSGCNYAGIPANAAPWVLAIGWMLAAARRRRTRRAR